jgi:hypothetical protein
MTHDVLQLALAGVPVGHRWMNRDFQTAVEHIAAVSLKSAISILLSQPLPALGIPSDLELFCDGNTIGQLFRAVRSTVLITGLTASVPELGGSCAVFVDAPCEGTDGRGDAAAALLKETLGRAPWNLTVPRLRARLAIAVGDGHYADGEESKHKPVDAFHRVFSMIGRVPRVAWSQFHRLDKAGTRACKKHALAAEFVELLKDLEAVFGGGQGRALDKQVCAFLGVKFWVGRVPSSTRKFAYFTDGPVVFLNKFFSYYAAIDVRRQHAEDGRGQVPPCITLQTCKNDSCIRILIRKLMCVTLSGTHSAQWYVDLGTRLANMKMLTFLMIFSETLMFVKPFVLMVQQVDQTPWAMLEAYQALRDKLQNQENQLKAVGSKLSVFRFLQPYLPAKDMQRFLLVWGFHALTRCSKLLVPALPQLVTEGRFQGLDVLLDVVPHDQDQDQIFLHPTCQCRFRRRGEQGCSRHLLRGQNTSMACWVAPHGPMWNQAAFGPQRPQDDFPSAAFRSSLRQRALNRGCLINRRSMFAFERVLEAMKESAAFIHELLQELVLASGHGSYGVPLLVNVNCLHESVLINECWLTQCEADYCGDVGVRRDLAFLQESSSAAFHPSVLCQQGGPSESAVDNFSLVSSPQLVHAAVLCC